MDHDTRETAEDRRESEAVVNARNRIALITQTYGTNHPEYATGLNQLALLLIMQGEPQTAEPLLRQALEVRRETLGTLHPDYATNLSSLGGLLWARGDLEQAEPLLRQALEVRTESLGPGHPKSVVSLNSLEQLLKAKRDRVGPSPPLAAATRPPTAAPPKPPAPTPEPAVAVPVPTPPVVDVPAPEVDLASVERLAQALERLVAEFASLGDRLNRAGERIKGGFAPSDEDLTNAVSATLASFDRLRRDVVELASAHSIVLSGAGPSSLADVAAMLPELREAVAVGVKHQEVRRGALQALDQVDRLACPGDPAFAPLLACRKQSSALRRSISTAQPGGLPDDARRLFEGDHPLNRLVKLVAADDATDDTQWADWYDSVVAAFGDSLAISAARSRITITGA